MLSRPTQKTLTIHRLFWTFKRERERGSKMEFLSGPLKTDKVWYILSRWRAENLVQRQSRHESEDNRAEQFQQPCFFFNTAVTRLAWPWDIGTEQTPKQPTTTWKIVTDLMKTLTMAVTTTHAVDLCVFWVLHETEIKHWCSKTNSACLWFQLTV